MKLQRGFVRRLPECVVCRLLPRVGFCQVPFCQVPALVMCRWQAGLWSGGTFRFRPAVVAAEGNRWRATTDDDEHYVYAIAL
jgi:hypothetical protein